MSTHLPNFISKHCNKTLQMKDVYFISIFFTTVIQYQLFVCLFFNMIGLYEAFIFFSNVARIFHLFEAYYIL